MQACDYNGQTEHLDLSQNNAVVIQPCKTVLQRRCKLFVYGGCKGNQNNFLAEQVLPCPALPCPTVLHCEQDCVRRCGDEAAVAALPDLNPQPQLQEIGEDWDVVIAVIINEITGLTRLYDTNIYL